MTELPGLRGLSRTVILLGLVSFFTDFSSEMIYPLLPVFLAAVLGAGPAVLGLVEGVAESTAALVKLAGGVWADRVGRRKPFILAGYGLAGAVRPLIGLAATWPLVLGLRFLDRVGKGLRTSPRDALIAEATPPGRRGMAYGFHRAMDHAGAVVGPLVAAWLLDRAGLSLRDVFLLAAVPAAVVVLLIILGIKEHHGRTIPNPETPAGPPPERAWGREFKLFLAALWIFTLGNSTDAFLLLRLAWAGVPAGGVALLWSAHHVVKMLAAYAGGRLADRLGARRMVLAGWSVYALIYLGFAGLDSPLALIVVFLAYGLYFGLAEPAEKTLVAGLAPARLRGTAFGFFHGVVGLGALPASLLFGFLWQGFGGRTAFLTGAFLAAGAGALAWFAFRKPSG
ncbi:MAG: MFS transporter [Thermodesulfobacteriota bacterium]